jgi:2-polyprenyl-3-methyl-5-hydroxy-6-metoxy-1,4-benzoquinol methylase
MIDSAATAVAGSPVVENSRACPACGNGEIRTFLNISSVPVHCNVLWDTAAEARRAPRGSIRLAFCGGCGLVFNAAFDPALVTYDAAYENSLHYSPRFEAFAQGLARDLSERLALRGKLVAEVGCGKGEFLRQLCRIASARGLGIDASYDPTIGADPDDTVTFVREPFRSLPADVQPALILCRHVVEHLPEPRGFVAEFTAAAQRTPGCRVYLEVPNVLFTLRDLGIWDLIYEHCNYFSAPSLARLCESVGLRVERVEPAFGDQFLGLEATVGRPGAHTAPDRFRDALHELDTLVNRFGAEYRRKVAQWEARLAGLQAAGDTVALWGAGSKGITFVNTLRGGHDIACLVDLNPRKHGRFVPGTGQPVVSPDALTDIRPDVIVVMNPLYQQEIAELTARLGLQCRIELA